MDRADPPPERCNNCYDAFGRTARAYCDDKPGHRGKHGSYQYEMYWYDE